MKKIFFTLLTLTLLFFLALGQTPDKVIPVAYKNLKNPYSEDAKTPKIGYKIYMKACWVCHGDNGNGKGPQSSEIKTKVADFKNPVVAGRTDGELLWWIQTGGNDMESFKNALSEDDIWMIITYIRKIQKDS